MADVNPRAMALFFEVYEGLPRQGPGNRAAAARALSLCVDLPARPEAVDLGCGGGTQSRYVAELTGGTVTAIDRHLPFLHQIQRRKGTARVRPVAGDLASPGLAPGACDLVWSEGALYNIGLDRALPVAYELLRPGGYLVFTDAVYTAPDPPPPVRAVFEPEYPGMGLASMVADALVRHGFQVLGHFALPDAAWWDDFYTPMERRIDALRAAYAADDEALAVLGQIAEEITFHRTYSGHYAYEYFVARRP